MGGRQVQNIAGKQHLFQPGGKLRVIFGGSRETGDKGPHGDSHSDRTGKREEEKIGIQRGADICVLLFTDQR